MSATEAKEYGVIDLIHGQTDASASADLAEAAIRAAEDSSQHGTRTNRKR
jgi:hypothetical protein